MNDKSRPPSLEECLQRHEDEIVGAWEREAVSRRQTFPFRLEGSATAAVRELSREVTDRITGQAPTTTPSCGTGCHGMDEHTVLNAIHTLRLGEPVFAEEVRARMKASDADWLAIRHRINRAFREVMLDRSTTNCAACNHHQKEEMATLSKLEDGLRRAFQKGA